MKLKILILRCSCGAEEYVEALSLHAEKRYGIYIPDGFICPMCNLAVPIKIKTIQIEEENNEKM